MMFQDQGEYLVCQEKMVWMALMALMDYLDRGARAVGWERKDLSGQC